MVNERLSSGGGGGSPGEEDDSTENEEVSVEESAGDAGPGGRVAGAPKPETGGPTEKQAAGDTVPGGRVAGAPIAESGTSEAEQPSGQSDRQKGPRRGVDRSERSNSVTIAEDGASDESSIRTEAPESQPSGRGPDRTGQRADVDDGVSFDATVRGTEELTRPESDLRNPFGPDVSADLSNDEIRRRVAEANVGVDPEDVEVSRTQDGGFEYSVSLDAEDLRERAAAANEGVSADDIFIREDEGGDLVFFTETREEVSLASSEDVQQFLKTGEVTVGETNVPVGSQSISLELDERYKVGSFASQYTDEDVDASDLTDRDLFSIDLDPNPGGYASQYTDEPVGDAGDEFTVDTESARTAAGVGIKGVANLSGAPQSIASTGIEAGQQSEYIARGEDEEFSEEDFVEATGYQRGDFASQFDPDSGPEDDQTGRAEEVATDVGEQAIATGEYLYDNPAVAAGTIASGAIVAGPLSVTAGATLGRAGRFVRDRKRTVGGTKVDLGDVTQESVRRNVEGDPDANPFPAAADPELYRRDPPAAVRQQAREKTPEDVEERFAEAGVGEGVTLKKALDVEPEGPGSGRVSQGFKASPGETLEDFDYETPGAFFSPEVSPYFFGTEARSAFSLRPGTPDFGGRPTGVLARTDVEAPEAKSLQEFNQEMIERSGETTARTKPPSEVAPGEIEAVVPPGSEFADIGGGPVRNTLRRVGIGSDFYTEVAGRRIPLRPVADPDAVGSRKSVRSRLSAFLDDDRGQTGLVQTGRRGDPDAGDGPVFTGRSLEDLYRPLRRPTDRPTPAPLGLGTAPDSNPDRSDRERSPPPSSSPPSSPPPSSPPPPAPTSSGPPSDPSSGPPSNVGSGGPSGGSGGPTSGGGGSSGGGSSTGGGPGSGGGSGVTAFSTGPQPTPRKPHLDADEGEFNKRLNFDKPWERLVIDRPDDPEDILKSLDGELEDSLGDDLVGLDSTLEADLSDLENTLEDL